MKTAFVTGATGCIGRNLIEELLRGGWKITAVHRKSSNISELIGLDIELREVDLHDPQSILNAMPQGVDSIFHVAGNLSHWPAEEMLQWKTNVLATRYLIQAALKKQAGRFIFTSTGATYPYSGFSRAASQRISSSYIRTKRLAEIEIYDGIEKGLDAVIIRPIIVFGRYDYNSYSQFFTQMSAGTLSSALPGKIDFCDARSIAKAHVSAYRQGRKGEAYLLGGPHVSWLDVMQKIGKLVGARKIPTKVTPRWMLYLVAYPTLWLSYLTRKRPGLTPQVVRLLKPGGTVPPNEVLRAKQELQYQSLSIDEMLKVCHDWLVEVGQLPGDYPNSGIRGLHCSPVLTATPGTCVNGTLEN